MEHNKDKGTTVGFTKVKNEIPSDAFNLEVFAFKNSEVDGLRAYIGFKIPNGNFHFINVPYTEPKQETDDVAALAVNYVERFWYEQPENIKSKIRLAFKAGYLAPKKVIESNVEDEFVKWLDEAINSNEQWLHSSLLLRIKEKYLEIKSKQL